MKISPNFPILAVKLDKKYFKNIWLKMEKIKSVHNCPKWQENWTKKFFEFLTPPTPKLGSIEIWLIIRNMKKKKICPGRHTPRNRK